MFKHIRSGIDIGTDCVKYAAVNLDNLQARSLWEGEFLPVRESREQTLTFEKLLARMTALMKTCKTSCPTFSKSVSTAVQGEGTILQYFELPETTAEGIEIAVRAQALKLLPFPLEQVSLTHVKVPALSSDATRRGLLMVAAQKESVDYIRSLVESAGMEVSRMEVHPLALAREFAVNHQEPGDRFYAIVSVGFRHTHVVVTRNGFPYFAREFTLGGRDFTYAFQMGNQCSWEEAERQKRAYDTLDRTVGIEPFVQRWLDEVRKSFDFFRKQLLQVDTTIHHVWLSGGSASWRSLDKRLEAHVEAPVTIDGWGRLKHEGGNQEGKLSVVHKTALGLALQE